MSIPHQSRLVAGIAISLTLLTGVTSAQEAPETDALDGLIAEVSPILKAQRYDDAAAMIERALPGLDPTAPREKWFVVSSFLHTACRSLWQGDRYTAALQGVVKRIATQDAGADGRLLRHQLLLELARFHFDRFQDAEALRLYSEVQDMDDVALSLAAAEQLLRIYTYTGRPKDAYRMLQGPLWEALCDRETNREALQRMAAEACLQAGDVKKAVVVLDAAKSLEGKRAAGTLLLEAGLLDDAEVVSESLGTDAGEDALFRARVLFEQRRFAASARTLQECYEREPAGSELGLAMATQLADVYIADGMLPDAIARAHGAVDAIPAEHLEPKRRALLLLSRFHMADDDYVPAFRAYLDYLGAEGKVHGLDAHAQTVCFAAVRTLVDEGRTDQAKSMLDEMLSLGVTEVFLDCARYMLLRATEAGSGAEERLLALEKRVDEEEKVYFLLMVQFDAWWLPDAGARFARRILATPPERSPFDAAAHRHLGDYHLRREEYAEAAAQYDLFDASLVRRNADPQRLRAARRNEVIAKFYVAGKDPAVLAELLRDPRHGRRMAAATLLGSAGTVEQLPAVEALAETAHGELRSALLDAATRIRSRSLAGQTDVQPLSIEEMAEQLAESSSVLWIMRDLRRPHQRWAALQNEFVALVDVEKGTITRFIDDISALVDEPGTARDLAFTHDAVWVGTTRGLFSYDRENGEWRAHLVGGRFPEASISEVRTRGDKYVRVTIDSPKPSRRYFYDYARGRWTEAGIFGLRTFGRRFRGAAPSD